ncbi:hypothetical protein [Microbacterium sp.]|uniref:hypothetical protein n=1 Tax=Microbacterium sp. TaxID=51671 RepID=UPI0039E45698
MSTPDEPEAPQLTRRQLRELRNTASTPIITAEDLAAVGAESAQPVVAPLPRAADPVVVAEEPPAEADVDLDSPALTRRAARQQERLRTASVPVVSGEVPVATAAGDGEDAVADDAAHGVEDVGEEIGTDAVTEHADQVVTGEAVTIDEAPVADEDAEAVEDAAATAPASDGEQDLDDVLDELADVEPVRAVVASGFGSGLLAGEGVELELPASFDQLLGRGASTGGSLATPNALILSQTPDTGSFTSPVAATGEVIITGTFNLPESLGSTGTLPGATDGKDIDAVLIDGELPSASSPTPISASAAISTIKSAEDIIKPPAPEKGGRLMLTLMITAGVLALALTGVIIVAMVTGAFR